MIVFIVIIVIIVIVVIVVVVVVIADNTFRKCKNKLILTKILVLH